MHTNLWRQRKQEHKWNARRQDAARVLFNMSHRQCPWCASLTKWASGEDDGYSSTRTKRYQTTTLDMFPQVPLHQVQTAWQVFSFASCSAATLTLCMQPVPRGSDATRDKLKRENWIILSNCTSVGARARAVWFSLGPGENTHSKRNES